MPYTIKKVKNGYKVCKKNEPTECFSKEGIPEENAKKQMTAIIMNEKEGGLKPLTARVGGKVLLKKKIVDDYFPSPDSYSTYVEPFVGGGSIYFYKNKDNHKEVINDIDPDIMTLFKGFQKYPGKKIAEDVNGDYTDKDFEDIKISKPTSDYSKFLKTFLLYRLSFFGRGLSFGKPRINAKFDGYQDRLENVTIMNTDYKDVIKKYNTASTFFYLDPPARESSGNYRYSSVDLGELVKVLKTIKGKFLLSIADIDVKKDIFKPYKIFKVPTKYVGKKQKGGQSMKVNEYLIMNYEPRMEGGMKVVGDNVIMPKKEFIEEHERLTNFFTKEAKDQGEELQQVKGSGTHRENVIKNYDLEDKGHSLEELSEVSSVPLSTLQEVYNRGIGAYKTNPQSVRLKNSYVKNVKASMKKKLSTEQWAMARVYSFLDGNPKHDNDLRGGHKEQPKSCGGCMGACGGAVSDFQKKLNDMGLKPAIYLKKAKEMAKKNGYDPSKVIFCTTGTNKLEYESPDGQVHFGNPDYPDFIIYSWLEHKGEVDEGTADKRRELYRARATNIKGNWKKNKYSANNLAINILW